MHCKSWVKILFFLILLSTPVLTQSRKIAAVFLLHYTGLIWNSLLYKQSYLGPLYWNQFARRRNTRVTPVAAYGRDAFVSLTNRLRITALPYIISIRHLVLVMLQRSPLHDSNCYPEAGSTLYELTYYPWNKMVDILLTTSHMQFFNYIVRILLTFDWRLFIMVQFNQHWFS